MTRREGGPGAYSYLGRSTRAVNRVKSRYTKGETNQVNKFYPVSKKIDFNYLEKERVMKSVTIETKMLKFLAPCGTWGGHNLKLKPAPAHASNHGFNVQNGQMRMRL
jgi:hypothetical protein